MTSLTQWTDRTRRIVSQFWRECRPTRLRDIGDWAEAELVLPSGPAEGRRYKIDRLPYARLLLEELGKWRRHVITGPTQSGKSLHAFAMLICYYLFEVKEDVIVGICDLGMAAAKWEKDLKPLIEKSRYAHLLPKTGPGSKGGRPTLITFLNGKSLQFLGGGGSDKQRASSSSKILIITETDGLDAISVSSKEGQNKIDQLEGRIRSHGLDGRAFFECTVSTRNGFTWKEYTAGTQSRIACRCVYCNEYVTPEREHFVGWDQAKTKTEAGRKAAFSCPSCGQLLTEADRLAMNLRCVLVHRGQEVTPEGIVTGEPPETDTLGFRWSAFNNLLSPMSLIGMEEWAAERAEDPTAAAVMMKQQVWCIPADDEQVEKTPITIAIVRGSATGYEGRCNRRDKWIVPEWSQYITAHIDVGLRVLNWSVNAHGPHRLRDVIAYGATATEQPDMIGPEEAILGGLHRVREIIEEHCDLTLGLIDAGYQGNAKEKNPRRVVYEFVLSAGSHWKAAMGLSAWTRKTKSDDITPSLSGAPWYHSRQIYRKQTLWVVNFEPNHFKHLSQGSYVITPSDKASVRVNGSVTLFGADPKSHNEFASQLNNERFEVDHKTGKSEWKRHGHNHFFDTDVGNIVARSVLESITLSKANRKPRREIKITF